MALPSAYGLPALRVEIAAYLQVSRGISCAPRQIFVTSGYRQTIELIARAVLKAGDDVWFENPGYPPTREVLEHMNIATVPVPVDREGVIISDGIKAAPHARAAVVTPAHQSPLSVSLSLPRRLALLDWASQNNAWVIEDDYDGEYRYVGRPLPALKSLIVTGASSIPALSARCFFQAFGLHILPCRKHRSSGSSRSARPLPGQPRAYASHRRVSLRKGASRDHIQRMRTLYAERREATIAGLESVLGKHIRIDSQPGGIHLILRLQDQLSDRHLAMRMREDGLYAEALTDWTIGRDRVSALFVSFTNVASQGAAENLGRRILRLI